MRKRALTLGPLLATAVLLILITDQHRRLLSQYDIVAEYLRSPPPGPWFPEIMTRLVDGGTACIGGGGGASQVLLFFSTSCHDCAEALSEFSVGANAVVSGRSSHALAVSLDEWDETRRFVEDVDASVPVTAFPYDRWSGVFSVREVPHVVVLDREGQVRFARKGLATARLIADSVLPVVEVLQRIDSLDSPEVVSTCGNTTVYDRAQQGG